MKKVILFCISMLLFVSASAFENGGKLKFEKDRFVLLEHSQVQSPVLESQVIFTQMVASSAERPVWIKESVLIMAQLLPLNAPESFRNRDVGWQINSGVNQLNIAVAKAKTGNPYRNCLRLYCKG